MKSWRWLAWIGLGLAGAVTVSAQMPAPPLPLREFRGAWVATVHGVDWPFEPGDPSAKQQKELLEIIEKASQLKLNALIFQVRPAGDAVYQSNIEPWSPYFTGVMGRAPNPLWDPLQFMITECHARGIEVHAWFNPYRALANTKHKGTGKHITAQHPEWCWKYGEYTWMCPGERGVQQRGIDVITDVVRRYDVDGVHLDDYFYPYPIKDKTGRKVEFPDHRSWNAYQASGGRLTRSEWRRANVDLFVQRLYTAIKAEKRWVRFGISPFGIWRPNHPEGIAKGALDAYEDLGADSLRWFQAGWCDYLAPQLYWPSEPKNLSFPLLFDWWLTQNTSRRHVWPGMASERVLKDRQPHEILKQISHTRMRGAYMPPGHIHWNFTALAKNKGTLADLCVERAYQNLAIPPSAAWLGSEKPASPILKLEAGAASWGYADTRLDAFVKWWLVQAYENGRWTDKKLQPAEMRSFVLTKEMTGLAVRAIGHTGMASDPAMVR
jgi:uncharacterized lipoprotein YddW (UPF0748 family)